MPTKRLPASANIDHLRSQARDFLSALGRGEPSARQRLAEFHPRSARVSDAAAPTATLTWSDALLVIAREYGYASWARIKRAVSAQRVGAPPSFAERIHDPKLREAVEALDDGDVDALGQLLKNDPTLVERRANFEGENYFRTPTLLAFIAENPTRNEALPPNIVAVTEMLLDAGAGGRSADIDEALALVASGRVARECGVQTQLIALLCSRGANPDAALEPALVHGEFDAARALLDAGATPNVAFAAAMGEASAVGALVKTSTPRDRHLALALASMHRQTAVVELLLAAGEDPNRYNPIGAHAHSTPLHQAAQNGDIDTVRVLMDGGARIDFRDTVWNATAPEWADHAGHTGVAEFLRSSS